MKNIKLLDCTLRDGGYVNDWEFGHDTLLNVLERLISSKVDIIEIGFLDERRAFDINRSIMPNTESVAKIYGLINKGNAMIVGMIDYGTCNIDKIQECKDSYLDGIRVIFKEHLMYEAIDFCKKIKAKGYKVFTQMVSVTTYTDEKLKEFCDLVNELEPYAVSMVDTYGLLHQDGLMHIFKELDKNLLKSISIGYHAHNNFQLGYANGIEFLDSDVSRQILVDGTLYGMGKSAGNAPLELLAMHLNDKFNKNYDISQMLEAIDVSILEIYHKKPWGYNLFFYISASTKCHPNYVSFLMNKHTLSIKTIVELLNSIPFEKKLLYDKKCIENIYLDYQKVECNDTDSLKQLSKDLKNKKILVLGPGKSIENSFNKIEKYINETNPIIFSINFTPTQIKSEYLFLTNSKRYVQMATALATGSNSDIKIVATSNVTNATGSFPYTLNYSSLIDETSEVPDNSLVMLLRTLIKIDVKDVTLAGFDGYSANENNYFNTSMEYSFAKEKADYLNKYVKNFITSNKNIIKINIITKSYYQDKE